MSATGRIVTGDGCGIFWRCDGDPDAPVLLLSNSLGTTLDMWAPQVDVLARTHRVLRYDTRGHGRSDAPAGAYSLDRLGRDVVELLDGLRIEAVDFCGLSLGGMIGQWLGYQAPERLRRLVLANTSAYMGPPSGWQGRIETVGRAGMEAVVAPLLERWFTTAFRLASPAVVETVSADLRALDAGGYIGCCAAIRDMDLRPTARLIGAPTLVLGGAEDPATPPDHSRYLADQVPGASLAFLDAAHLSNIERPQEFTAAVRRFLSAD